MANLNFTHDVIDLLLAKIQQLVGSSTDTRDLATMLSEQKTELTTTINKSVNGEANRARGVEATLSESINTNTFNITDLTALIKGTVNEACDGNGNPWYHNLGEFTDTTTLYANISKYVHSEDDPTTDGSKYIPHGLCRFNIDGAEGWFINEVESYSALRFRQILIFSGKIQIRVSQKQTGGNYVTHDGLYYTWGAWATLATTATATTESDGLLSAADYAKVANLPDDTASLLEQMQKDLDETVMSWSYDDYDAMIASLATQEFATLFHIGTRLYIIDKSKNPEEYEGCDFRIAKKYTKPDAAGLWYEIMPLDETVDLTPYAKLTASQTFTGKQTVKGDVEITGSSFIWNEHTETYVEPEGIEITTEYDETFNETKSIVTGLAVGDKIRVTLNDGSRTAGVTVTAVPYTQTEAGDIYVTKVERLETTDVKHDFSEALAGETAIIVNVNDYMGGGNLLTMSERNVYVNERGAVLDMAVAYCEDNTSQYYGMEFNVFRHLAGNNFVTYYLFSALDPSGVYEDGQFVAKLQPDLGQIDWLDNAFGGTITYATDEEIDAIADE